MDGRIIEIIPDINEIEKSLRLTDRFGAAFEYNDFMFPWQLDDEEGCREKIVFYQSLGRDLSMDTMHGAFLDITVHSQDPLVRGASERRVRQSMEIAQELGIRGVVFHTGLLRDFREASYRRNWLEMNEDFWSRILEEFPCQAVYMENMFDEDEECLVALAKRMEPLGRFGICLDYGHAAAFGRKDSLARWMENAAPFIRHMHVNDNDLKDDLHLPLGRGAIDWRQFSELMDRWGMDASVLLEVSGFERQEESLEYIREHHIL